MSESEQKSERRRDRSEIPFDAAKKQLETITRDGRLKAALLATEEGLAVVNVESEHDTDSLAALAGFLWNTSKDLMSLTGMSKIDQITLAEPNGDTIICRFFELLGEPVVLGVIAVDGDDRRPFTDRAIEGLKRIFAEHNSSALLDS